MEANGRSDTFSLMKRLIRYKIIVKLLRFLINLVEFDIKNVILTENHNFQQENFEILGFNLGDAVRL